MYIYMYIYRYTKKKKKIPRLLLTDTLFLSKKNQLLKIYLLIKKK